MIRTSSVILCAVLAGLLAGCGLRGPLEPPPGEYVYTTPNDPNSRHEDQRPGDDFVLDPLID